MNRILTIICITVCSVSCMKGPEVSNMAPCANVPAKVNDWFNSLDGTRNAFGDASAYDVNEAYELWSCIIDNEHKELSYNEKGYIVSKHKGWSVSVKYEPALLYEDNAVVVVQTIPGWREPFSSAGDHAFVIRKTDGRILYRFWGSTKEGTCMGKYAVLDDVFYFVTGSPEEIYCIDLQEWE